jgi:hypothetical protein
MYTECLSKLANAFRVVKKLKTITPDAAMILALDSGKSF